MTRRDGACAESSAPLCSRLVAAQIADGLLGLGEVLLSLVLGKAPLHSPVHQHPDALPRMILQYHQAFFGLLAEGITLCLLRRLFLLRLLLGVTLFCNTFRRCTRACNSCSASSDKSDGGGPGFSSLNWPAGVGV